MELSQPEERNDGVADELLDLTAVAPEDRPCDARIPLQDPVHRLRIEELSEGGGIDDVRENDSRRPPRADGFSQRRHTDRVGRNRELARDGLELRVLREHPALELNQLLTRLEAELVGEQRARLAVDLEGVAPSSGR